MHYLRQLEVVLKYIEEHLDKEIRMDVLAKTADYSIWEMPKCFKAIVGETILEYIYKRRLTTAAYELCHTKTDIRHIGDKYGYKSKEAFTRAFHDAYNMTPDKCRTLCKYYPVREPFVINYLQLEHEHQKSTVQPTIKYMEQMDVVGMEIDVPIDGNNMPEIPLFWQAWHQGGYYKTIQYNKYESECLGIYKYSQTNRFKFMIGVPVHMFGNQEVDFINYTIPATTYAVFSAYRPITQSVQSIWDYIYGIWLQNSEYTRGVGDDFEYYFLRQGELFADVYIPVEKA